MSDHIYYYIYHRHEDLDSMVLDYDAPANYELRLVQVEDSSDGATRHETIILESRFRNELERAQKYLENDVRFGSDEHILTYENEEWFQYASKQGWEDDNYC